MKLYRFMSLTEFEEFSSGKTLRGSFTFFPASFKLEKGFSHSGDENEDLLFEAGYRLEMFEALRFVEECRGEIIVEFETIGFEPELKQVPFRYEKSEDHYYVYYGNVYVVNEYSPTDFHATGFSWNECGEPEKWYKLNGEIA